MRDRCKENRKVVITAVLTLVVAVLGLLQAFGVAIPEEVYTTIMGIAAAFGVGNGMEHIGGGMGRRGTDSSLSVLLVAAFVGLGAAACGGAQATAVEANYGAVLQGDIDFSGRVGVDSDGTLSRDFDGGGQLQASVDTKTCFGQSDDVLFCIPAGGLMSVVVDAQDAYLELCYSTVMTEDCKRWTFWSPPETSTVLEGSGDSEAPLDL